MFNRRNRMIAAVGGLGVATVALTGCLGSGGAPTEEGKGDGSITFQSLAWQPSAMEAVKGIVADWNAENPDNQVTVTFGDWGSVDDELTTSFEGGTAPDVIHYEAGPIKDFVDRGNLANIDEFISDETREDIRDSAWDTVEYPDVEGVYGVPFLQETQVIFVNTKMFEEAGIPLPTVDDPWTWDEYQAVAQQLTVDADGDGTPNQYGSSFPLKNPTDRLLNLGPSAGAEYFDGIGKDASVIFGEPEAFIPSRIHTMLYEEKTADPELINGSASDTIPAFLGGRNASLVAPIYLRAAITEGAKEDFTWDAVPLPVEESLAQGSTSQTLSVTTNAADKEAAMKFVEFFANPENQVRVADSDWLIPTSTEAAASEVFATEEFGWDVAIATAEDLTPVPFQKVNGIEEWTSRISNPAFSQYFSNEIDLDELSRVLVEDGNAVLARYQR